jgi:hypothetical protein
MYLGLGWLGLISSVLLVRRFGYRFTRHLIHGGLAYTAGAVLEFLRWPVVFQGVLGGRHRPVVRVGDPLVAQAYLTVRGVRVHLGSVSTTDIDRPTTEVLIRVAHDDDATRISAVLEALGYCVLRQLGRCAVRARCAAAGR